MWSAKHLLHNQPPSSQPWEVQTKFHFQVKIELFLVLNHKMRFLTFFTKFQEEDKANGKKIFFPEYEFQSMST